MTAMDPIVIINQYNREAPVNIEAAIRDLGIVLRKDSTDLPNGISGQIRRLDDGRYEISTPKSEHYFRQRFTMAHELGHYILHRELIGEGIDDDTMYRSTLEGNFYNTRIQQIHESQANSFAANFLMPSRLVREYASQHGNDVRELMKKFQVSPSAMKWRLNSLNIEAA